MFKKRAKKGDTKRKLDLDNGPEETIHAVEQETKFKKSKVTSAGAAHSDTDHTPQYTEAPAPAPKLKPVSDNVKTVTITDFQPDVCKDFMQTGYCGYGDTCKFLHIRDESRQKKPISRDWEMPEKEAKEDLPFKCVICKDDYKVPVQTPCGHVFCKACFLGEFKKGKPCAVCKKETNGIMVPVKQKEEQKGKEQEERTEKDEYKKGVIID